MLVSANVGGLNILSARDGTPAIVCKGPSDSEVLLGIPGKGLPTLSSSSGGRPHPLQLAAEPSCGCGCSPAVVKGNEARPLPGMLLLKLGLLTSGGSGKQAGRTDVGEFLGAGLGTKGLGVCATHSS